MFNNNFGKIMLDKSELNITLENKVNDVISAKELMFYIGLINLINALIIVIFFMIR